MTRGPASRASLSEEGDRKQDAMQNMASRPRSFHDDLTEQLSFFDCDSTVQKLAEYIIYNLDDNGYLKFSLHEVIRDSGTRPRKRRPRKPPAGPETGSSGRRRSRFA